MQLGPFVLGHPLGSGGTGTVYHAVHAPSGIAAAVKVVRQTADRRVLRNDLDLEVRAVVALDHPNIVQVYDVGVIDAAAAARSDGALAAGTPWYAMELADDGSLRRRLRSLDWGELAPVLIELLDALAHAHARGVLHLDLKPDNVLFGGRRPGAKLSDFGMGVVGPANPDDDFVRGTPHYMAPEQVRGRWEELGPWTDLYALGCLAWRCVTGEMPIGEGAPREVLEAQVHGGLRPFAARFELPAGVEGWIRRLLHKDPEARYRFAADARRDLAPLAGLPTPSARLRSDWRVSERQGAAEVLPVTGLGLAAIREPPVVGRTRERERLWRALRSAVDGKVRVVILRGAHGVGKTRLARWLATRGHELGAAIPLIGGHHLGGPPDLGIVGAIRRRFPVDPRSPDGEVDLGVRLQACGLAAPDACTAAALLTRGIDRARGGDRPWPEVVADVLQVVARERTPIVVLDDVQWGAGSLEAVRWILANGRSPPAVWVLTADDEALAGQPVEDELLGAIATLPHTEAYLIGPLSEQASAALSRRLLPLDPAVSAEIARRGGGSPLFQVQLVHDWAQRRILEPGPHGFRLCADAQVSPAPATEAPWVQALDEVLAGRDDWRAALEVAAVLGPDVVPGEWQSACAELGLDASPMLVLSLLGHHLVRVSAAAERWSFVHPMLRDAITRRAQAEGRAAAIHRACARVVDPTAAERRAVHLVAAGHGDEALPALLAALDAGVGDLGRAIQLLELVDRVAAALPADDLRRAQIEGHRVRVLLALGRPEEARVAAARQRRVAGDAPGSAFAAERNLAEIALELADGPAALEHAGRIGGCRSARARRRS
ncbi:MAG: protein kinase [Myxococcota bacterium]